MESTENAVLYEKDAECPAIVRITFNRPEKANAISFGPGEMSEQFQGLIRQADDDDDVKVVILGGAGRHFCSGVDLGRVYRVYGGGPGVKPAQSMRLRIDEEQLTGTYRCLIQCKKVVIAQIRGSCIEMGAYLAECCDIAIAAESALFSHRGQRLAFGGMPFMPLELLEGHTKKLTELIITGRTITAKDAEDMGIITKAVPDDDLENECYHLARAIANYPADALYFGRMMRRHMYESLGLTSSMFHAIYHTMGTNLHYRENEKDVVFIRDREQLGTKAAFNKLHQSWEDELNKTKYFRSTGFGKPE